MTDYTLAGHRRSRRPRRFALSARQDIHTTRYKDLGCRCQHLLTLIDFICDLQVTQTVIQREIVSSPSWPSSARSTASLPRSLLDSAGSSLSSERHVAHRVIRRPYSRTMSVCLSLSLVATSSKPLSLQSPSPSRPTGSMISLDPSVSSRRPSSPRSTPTLG